MPIGAGRAGIIARKKRLVLVPTFVAATSQTGVPLANEAVTMTFPSGSQANDILVAVMTTWGTWAAPSGQGWVLKPSTAGYSQPKIYLRRLSAVLASESWTAPQNSRDYAVAFSLYRGVDPAADLATVPFAEAIIDPATETTYPFPSVTAPVSLLLFVGSLFHHSNGGITFVESNAAWSPGTNVTERRDVAFSPSSSGANGVFIGSESLPDEGASSSRSATFDLSYTKNTSYARSAAAYTLALPG
jgi:hypothetical protein